MKPLQPTNWALEDDRMEDMNALMISISYLDILVEEGV